MMVWEGWRLRVVPTMDYGRAEQEATLEAIRRSNRMFWASFIIVAAFSAAQSIHEWADAETISVPFGYDHDN